VQGGGDNMPSLACSVAGDFYSFDLASRGTALTLRLRVSFQPLTCGLSRKSQAAPPQRSRQHIVPAYLSECAESRVRETAKRQTRIASTNHRGDMQSTRLPQEDRITPRQRSDDETNSGNWRIDEADCDSSSEGSSGLHISPYISEFCGAML